MNFSTKNLYKSMNRKFEDEEKEGEEGRLALYPIASSPICASSASAARNILKEAHEKLEFLVDRSEEADHYDFFKTVLSDNSIVTLGLCDRVSSLFSECTIFCVAHNGTARVEPIFDSTAPHSVGMYTGDGVTDVFNPVALRGLRIVPTVPCWTKDILIIGNIDARLVYHLVESPERRRQRLCATIQMSIFGRYLWDGAK